MKEFDSVEEALQALRQGKIILVTDDEDRENEEDNTDNHETAFTVSIDCGDTTTGISAAERSITAMRCVAEDVGPQDFRRPGHMFCGIWG